MKRIFVGSAIAAVASFALSSAAQAQLTMPPGQEFYAAPVNKGPMMTMPAATVAQPAPAAKHKMKHRMHGKMMKRKM